MMKHSEATKKEALRLYQEGRSHQEIREALNIRSTQTVYRILEENGITPSRKEASRNGARRISLMLSAEAARILDEAAPKNVSLWISAQIIAANQDRK